MSSEFGLILMLAMIAVNTVCLTIASTAFQFVGHCIFIVLCAFCGGLHLKKMLHK